MSHMRHNMLWVRDTHACVGAHENMVEVGVPGTWYAVECWDTHHTLSHCGHGLTKPQHMSIQAQK